MCGSPGIPNAVRLHLKQSSPGSISWRLLLMPLPGPSKSHGHRGTCGEQGDRDSVCQNVGHLEQTVPIWPQNPEEICACSLRIGSGEVLHHTAGEHVTEGVISGRQVATVSDQKAAGKLKPASNLSRSNYGGQRRGNSDAVDSLSRCRKKSICPNDIHSPATAHLRRHDQFEFAGWGIPECAA